MRRHARARPADRPGHHPRPLDVDPEVHPARTSVTSTVGSALGMLVVTALLNMTWKRGSGWCCSSWSSVPRTSSGRTAPSLPPRLGTQPRASTMGRRLLRTVPPTRAPRPAPRRGRRHDRHTAAAAAAAPGGRYRRRHGGPAPARGGRLRVDLRRPVAGREGQRQDAGAEWIHLVDLDAAFGRGSNRGLIAQIVGRLDLDVELSGGIRDAESLAFALGTGCRRVNLGTAALEHQVDSGSHRRARRPGRRRPGCPRHPARGTGWTSEGGELWETLARLDAEGCARYVVTDVAKDGMLAGPNLQLLRDVCACTDRPVVASGGVSTLADVAAIRELVGEGWRGDHRVGAVQGAFTLTEALAVAGLP